MRFVSKQKCQNGICIIFKCKHKERDALARIVNNLLLSILQTQHFKMTYRKLKYSENNLRKHIEYPKRVNTNN